MRKKLKKIGEILIENNLITEDVLREALRYQEKYGGGITQYLVAYGYVREEDLAKCVSAQFGFPYLPIRVYNVPDEIVQLLPVKLAQKYCLMPIDKVKNILTVVMSNPLDEKAIKEIETVSGCRVQPFVGIFSDIIKAIEYYYGIVIDNDALKKKKVAPLFIDTESYKGLERRESIRLKTNIEVHFPIQKMYRESKTKDISPSGLLFESENMLPIGSFVILQINLPQEFSPQPIAAVVEVARVKPLKNRKFDIGVKILKIPNEDIKKLLDYGQLSSS